jgi:hypothetical protein
MIERLINCGLLLKIVYDDNNYYAYIARGDLLKCVFSDENYDENEIYDVILKNSIKLDSIKINSIEYVLHPVKEDIIFNQNIVEKLILLRDEKYIENLKSFIDKHVSIFNEDLEIFKKEIDGLDKVELRDEFILRFYPKIPKNKDNIISHYIKKYFTAHKHDFSSIKTLNLLHIEDKNFNTRSKIFIDALKRKWFKLIEKDKNEVLMKLKDADLSHLLDDEKEE